MQELFDVISRTSGMAVRGRVASPRRCIFVKYLYYICIRRYSYLYLYIYAHISKKIRIYIFKMKLQTYTANGPCRCVPGGYSRGHKSYFEEEDRLQNRLLSISSRLKSSTRRFEKIQRRGDRRGSQKRPTVRPCIQENHSKS